MRAHFTLAAIIAAAGFLASGCDSGATGPRSGPTPLVVDTLPVLTALTGYVLNDGTVVDSSSPTVGDFDQVDSTMRARGFVAFDLSGLPAGVTIKTANLRLYQKSVTGTPYASHGSLVLDHVDLGSSLDAGDYQSVALDSSFAVLSPDASTGIKQVNVLQKVRADVAGARTMTHFRLRFSLKDGNSDGVTDNVSFRSAAEFPPPLVIVTY